jgi:hypothetical protein
MFDRFHARSRERLGWLDAAGYTSMPRWRPWRDF